MLGAVVYHLWSTVGPLVLWTTCPIMLLPGCSLVLPSVNGRRGVAEFDAWNPLSHPLCPLLILCYDRRRGRLSGGDDLTAHALSFYSMAMTCRWGTRVEGDRVSGGPERSPQLHSSSHHLQVLRSSAVAALRAGETRSHPQHSLSIVPLLL